MASHTVSLAAAIAVLFSTVPASAQVAGSIDDVASTSDKKDEKNRKNKKYEPKLSGYVQSFYRYAFETGEDGVVDNNNFRVMRARLKVKGKISDRVGYRLEIDPRAPEITGVMRDAYVEIRVFEDHDLRIGQQKTHFGYENTESSTRLYAVNRSEIADSMMRGANLRDVGLGLIGHVDLGGGLRLEDGLTVTNGNGMNTQNDDTANKSVWGRVGARYETGAFRVWWGVSGAAGDFIDTGDLDLDPSDDFKLEFRRVGTDLRFENDWVFAAGELVWGRDTDPDETVDTTGFYASVAGKTPWRVGPIVRWDKFADVKERFTFGAYYGRPRDRLRFMINYEYRPVMEEVRGDDKLYLWMQARY